MLMGLQLRLHHPSEHGNHFGTALAVVRACGQAGPDSVGQGPGVALAWLNASFRETAASLLSWGVAL
jgi:hypothetical protein